MNKIQIKAAGIDGKGKNMPPYLAVYVWKRIGQGVYMNLISTMLGFIGRKIKNLETEVGNINSTRVAYIPKPEPSN